MDVFREKDSIWVATSSGLNHLEIPKTDTFPEIPLHFDKIRIGYVDTTYQDFYQLNHNQNSIFLEFAGISYLTMGNLFYKYRLKGLDSTWHISQSHEVEYAWLPPGEYEFEVDVSSAGKYWQNNIKSIKFDIQPALWNRLWFQLLVGGSSLLMLFLLVTWRIKTARAKERLRMLAEESKHTALRAQMNPHFIFNALNSIQRFIALNDQTAALMHLTKFSRMVRMVLEHSQHSEITLAEELTALRFYLDLELLRFGERFSYTIKVDPEIDEGDILLPPMLIQPVIENAIWHGLMPKIGKGSLLISLKKEKEQLLIEVEDDGVGFQKPSDYSIENKPKHTSRGVENIQERLKILTLRFPGTPATIQVINLKGPAGNPTGTKVKISLPLILE